MESILLYELVLTFLLSIVVTIICNKAKLPTIVGLLFTGVLCGPSLLGVISDVKMIDYISEIGIAMLLFTIGMELSGDALNRLKRPVFLGGSLQIGLTVIALALYVRLLGETWQSCILWGCIVSLSSSAIVLQLLQAKGATTTPSGRLSLAILVFQDIMVAPMLIIFPLLAGTLDLNFKSAILSCLWVILILGSVLIVIHLFLNKFMELVINTRSREILLLTILGFCMGMAVLTSSLGLSLSLGAFLAGLLLARSEYSMSIISGILPYRDVFMSIFFISIGMMLDIHFFAEHFLYIFFLTFLIISIKTLLTLPSILIQGYPLKIAIITSLSLAQIGEFSFVLANSGYELKIFSAADYQLLLASSILAMMLTPALINYGPQIAEKLTKHKNKELENDNNPTKCQLSDHLIIIGYGITGQYLAKTAKKSNIPYTILEINPETVRKYHNIEPISHGDATQPIVLEHLGIKKARVLAIIISHPAAVRAISIEAKTLNPDVYIVARTRFVTEVEILKKLGANAVISEEFETSIEVFSQVLAQYLVPQQDIRAFAEQIRLKNYDMVRSTHQFMENLNNTVNHLPNMGVQALRINKNSTLCGTSLAKSELRKKYGVTVVAINSNNIISPSPNPQILLQENDILYLFGSAKNLLEAHSLFCEPTTKDNITKT